MLQMLFPMLVGIAHFHAIPNFHLVEVWIDAVAAHLAGPLAWSFPSQHKGFPSIPSALEAKALSQTGARPLFFCNTSYLAA